MRGSATAFFACFAGRGRVALGAVLLLGLGLGACATAVNSRALEAPPRRVAAPTFPHNYATSPLYRKLTEAPIYRREEQVAHEVYGRITPDYGVGTVLVKEEFLVIPGEPRDMRVIGVMRRTADPEDAATGGWSFEAYDPATGSDADQDIAGCVSCHTLQKDSDYRFLDVD